MSTEDLYRDLEQRRARLCALYEWHRTPLPHAMVLIDEPLVGALCAAQSGWPTSLCAIIGDYAAWQPREPVGFLVAPVLPSDEFAPSVMQGRVYAHETPGTSSGPPSTRVLRVSLLSSLSRFVLFTPLVCGSTLLYSRRPQEYQYFL